MATTTEHVEAIIISGPRKGEFFLVPDDEHEPQLTYEEEKALDFLVEAYKNMAQSAVAASTSMDSLLQEVREMNRRLRESV